MVGADVITVSTKPWLDANLNSLVAPTGPALGKYWGGGSRYVYGDGRYVLVAATPLGGAGVNTEQLAKLGNPPVTTYKDLLQPQFKGALGIVPPGTGAPAAEQWWFYAAKEMGGDSAVGRLADLQPPASTRCPRHSPRTSRPARSPSVRTTSRARSTRWPPRVHRSSS